ncbi:DUF5000 domain-containing lipoprotein [Compostibacter hankyongensis]
MKYTRLLPLILLAAGALLFASCKEDQPAPQKNDGSAPAPVTKVSWAPLPGAVRISYAPPADADLFYVEAECETAKGSKVAKATFYDHAVVLNGFGDTSEYEVKLYAVDRGENRSEPVTVKVKPSLPPVLSVRNSIVIKEDFGGINLAFTNSTEANLVLFVLTPDSLGDWKEVDANYTKRPSGAFSVRGFPAVKRKFAVYVRDQWNNFSDTMVQEVVPLFEEEIDKKKFREYRLPTDAPTGFSWFMPRMWDGSIEEPNGFHTEHMGTADNPSGFPHHYTFDMGTVAKLSRFKIWQRGILSNPSFLYAHGNPRKFEIWGSTQPAQDGSWDGWTKLLDCESIKPSGLSIGQVSNEDKAYAADGEEYIFPFDAPPVRYIRVNVFSTWGGDDYSHIMEITLFGAEQ